MKEITDLLMTEAEESYAEFQWKLTPTVPREKFIGVRVPKIRLLAKKIRGSETEREFLRELPHPTYDENMLHSALLSLETDYETAVGHADAFLPYVDNWAVCDTMSPKAFAKNKGPLLGKIREWIGSGKVYTERFGIEMLMSHYLDGDFKPEYLKLPLLSQNTDYYVKMMKAWFYATALAKQWEDTFPVISEEWLPVWEHNKTIQKARESFRITTEQKELLSSFKK